MANHEQHARRYAEQAGTDDPHFYARGNSNVFALRDRGHDTIFSWGFHFPMARLMAGEDGNNRGWWLVNGDRYSHSTDQHQSIVRSALKSTGLPMLIVPFTAIDRSGIAIDTIRLVEVLPDRNTWEPRTRDKEPDEYELKYQHYARNWQQLGDGRWSYEASVHHLGEALFTAHYSYQSGPFNPDTGRYEYTQGDAYFLSAFDDNEPGNGLYFLAQLPEDAHPATVDEAREALKPAVVAGYERNGSAYGPVLRQGDVFAIPTNIETRGLPAPSKRSEYVLDTNHQATEVRRAEGHTYARGWLRHRPMTDWGTRRQAEHRAVKLGDGKTWFEVVRNTVPEGRSWSIAGNVD